MTSSDKNANTIAIPIVPANGRPGSVTPKVLLVTGSLNYRSNVVSVPEGSTVPDAAEYSREESASIWNASAKSVNVRWSFTASTPEQAEARMKALLDYDAAKAQESAE